MPSRVSYQSWDFSKMLWIESETRQYGNHKNLNGVGIVTVTLLKQCCKRWKQEIDSLELHLSAWGMSGYKHFLTGEKGTSEVIITKPPSWTYFCLCLCALVWDLILIGKFGSLFCERPVFWFSFGGLHLCMYLCLSYSQYVQMIFCFPWFILEVLLYPAVKASHLSPRFTWHGWVSLKSV